MGSSRGSLRPSLVAEFAESDLPDIFLTLT
jgi:hypothetical protein